MPRPAPGSLFGDTWRRLGAAVGTVPAATLFDSYKTIPLYSGDDIRKAIPIAKKVREVYRPPNR